jgi:acetyl-CoA C-acetyltransferase
LNQRVAIVASAQTKFLASQNVLSIGEMIWEVVHKVLVETGLPFEAQERKGDGPFIDKIISCSEDYWQGRTISDCLYHLEMGALGMDVTKVSADGAFAFAHAFVSILSGKHDVILVVAYRKESETSRHMIENAGFDPIYLRPLGLDFLMAAAMQANRYMWKYGVTEEQCARVVVQSRKHALLNPYAQEHGELTVSDVLGSEMLSSPIKRLDCKPVSDGACAMILAKGEIAESLTDKPVWIAGVGHCYDSHNPGDRDLADCPPALEIAAGKAYEMAGIKHPAEEVHLAEISGEYSYQELLWMEGLGFCGRGQAARWIEEGETRSDGRLPVNPSGGVLSGNPSGVSGLVRVAEASLQLKQQAGERQIQHVETALAHGFYGPNGQAHCVCVLKN